MFLSIALSRVAPVLGAVFREGWGVTGGDEVMEAVGLARVMERFGALIRAADRECESLFYFGFAFVVGIGGL